MRLLPPLIAVVLAAYFAAPVVRAADPSKVDPAKRDEAFAPSGNTKTPEKREMPRADSVQERRAPMPEHVDKETSPLGERRAAVDVEETREKTIIDKKKAPKPEVKTRELNRWDQKKTLFQPKEKTQKVEFVDRFQDRMKDASTAASQRKPELQKRSAFSAINRFVFRKNAPDVDTATPAGGGSAPSRP